MYDNIPPGIAIPLALILWVALIVIVFKDVFREKIDNFFAHRRHVRRMRTRKRREASYAYVKTEI